MEEVSPVSVVEQMLRDDRFSQWLGIEVLEIREGYSRIRMRLRDEMMNGLGRIHGGIAFSFADSAFAFACNNRNNLSVALDTNITFNRSLISGDTIMAEAEELHDGRSTGLYLVKVTDDQKRLVALFKGTCFRTGNKLI